LCELLNLTTDLAELRSRAEIAKLDDARDFFLLGHRQFFDGNLRKALPNLQEAARRDPGHFGSWFVQGNCLYEMHQDAKAAGCFNVCVTLQPEEHRAWFNRGLANFRQGQLPQALADFDKAIDLKPDAKDLAKILINRAQLALEMKEYDKAVRDLSRAEELGFTRNYLYFTRAKARRALKDPEGAARDEKKGLEQKPADERSWVEHGLALVRKPQPGRWLILPVGAVAGHAA